MVKHRGGGWWGERYRHRLASLKGWRQRRTISRSLKRYHKEHLEDGHKMAKDVQIRAEATYPTSDKAAIRRWKEDPAHSDILGVDTDLWRRLKAPQVKARAIYRKSKERVQKVVQDFKVEKRIIEKSKVSKKEKRKRVKQEADRTIRKVAAEHDAAEKISEDAKKEQRKAIARYVKPWDRERKRRAAMVARSLASDMITADALIVRAERKGWDYDTVNWDELQGKDLMFMDRLNRLERQTGETQTRMEEEGEIDWQIEKYEAEYQEWVKAEAREVAERGETKIPKDMAMQKDFSGGGRMEFTVEKKKGLVKPRRQESKVKPRMKPKEQAILTSKEELAKSRLPKGQETIVKIKAETETELWGGQRHYPTYERASETAEQIRVDHPDWIVEVRREGEMGAVVVLASKKEEIDKFYDSFDYTAQAIIKPEQDYIRMTTKSKPKKSQTTQKSTGWEGLDNKELAERYKELVENERKAPSEEGKRQIRSWENEILSEFHRRLPEDEADEVVTSLVKGERVKLPKERQSKKRAKKGDWQDSEPVSYTNIGVGSKVIDKSGAVYEIVGVELPDTVPAHRIYTLKYARGKMGKRPKSKYGEVVEPDIILDQKLGQMERHYRKVQTSYERQEARDEAHQTRRRQTWAKIEKGERYVINASAGKKRYGEIIGKSARVVEKRDPGYSYPITVEVDGERYHLSPKALSKKRGKPSSQKSRKSADEQTLFFEPRYQKYADIVKMDTPANAKKSVAQLTTEFYDAKSPEKLIRITRVARATSNRAQAVSENKRISAEQRKEAREVAKIYKDFADFTDRSTPKSMPKEYLARA